MKKHVGFRIPEFLAKKLQEEADRSNRALTTVIVDILERHYEIPALSPGTEDQGEAIAKIEELGDRMKTWEYALESLSEKIADLNQRHLAERQDNLDRIERLERKHKDFREFALPEIKSLGEAIAPLSTKIETVAEAVDKLWHWKAESQCALVSQPSKTIEVIPVEQPVKRLEDDPDVKISRRPDPKFPEFDLVTYTYPGGQNTNRESAESQVPQAGQPGDIERAIAEMEAYCGDDDGETPLKPIDLAVRLKVNRATISKWQNLSRENQKAKTKPRDPSGFGWQYSGKKKLWYPYPPEAGL